jgi:hypothetical protein
VFEGPRSRGVGETRNDGRGYGGRGDELIAVDGDDEALFNRSDGEGDDATAAILRVLREEGLSKTLRITLRGPGAWLLPSGRLTEDSSPVLPPLPGFPRAEVSELLRVVAKAAKDRVDPGGGASISLPHGGEGGTSAVVLGPQPISHLG